MVKYNHNKEEVIGVLEKNKEKEKRKSRDTWVGYYPRVTKDKKKYSRKEKHKNNNKEQENKNYENY